MRERTAELRAQAERLSEMNAALKVLLRQREEDRAELERTVLANVRSRIKPALDLLAGLGGEPRILDLLEDVRRGLRELTEPFCFKVVLIPYNCSNVLLKYSTLLGVERSMWEVADRKSVV